MKSKKKIIFPLLITIVIGVILILGIMWVNKHYLNKKDIENFNASEGQKLGDNILAGATAQMEAAGVDTSNIDKQLESAFDQLGDLITNEKDVIADQNGLFESEMDSSGSVIDTTTVKYNDKTFFEGSRFSDGFCQTSGGTNNPNDLNRKCGRLTHDNCTATDCCVLLNGKRCVAGNANGPLYLVDQNNNDIDYSYYSHKNECYGSCGGKGKSANPCSIYKDSEANVSKDCLERLWKQTGCPNEYITDAKQEELKDYSKLSIKNMFKEATLEQNFDKCYGPEGGSNPWPPACENTESSTFNLSARCLTKLFNDAGCSNNSMINDVYVADNKLEPKSAMINKFAEIKNGKDLESYKKCYGRDELTWPNPCEGVDETAQFNKGEVPYICSRKVWSDITQCPNSDYIKYMYHDNKESISKMKDDFTLATYRKGWENLPVNYISSIRPYCYGLNPNNWPDVQSKMNDPCINLNYNTKWGDLMPDCQKRILDLYADTNQWKKELKNDKETETEKYNKVSAWLIIVVLEENKNIS